MLGKFIKYVFWSALVLIVGLLLIGLSKFNWNVKGYVQSLNDKSRSEAWEVGGVSGIFWGDVDEELEEDSDLTGDVEEGNIEEGLDVYDPSFEEGLNNIPKKDLDIDDDVEDKEFGFVALEDVDEDLDIDVDSGDSKDQLLELIKEREME